MLQGGSLLGVLVRERGSLQVFSHQVEKSQLTKPKTVTADCALATARTVPGPKHPTGYLSLVGVVGHRERDRALEQVHPAAMNDE